jgi:predicted transposase/invertase (TIGR01784 family)
VSADPETRAIADLRQRTINDRNSEMTVAKEEAEQKGEERGIAIGEERGEARGEQKKAIEMAKKLLRKGTSIDEIVDLTELSEQEILQLKASL